MTRELRTEAELRTFVAEPARAIAEKAIDHVDAESARFIAASPFFLLATAAADGTCDVSPRGDPPGSVLVLDDRTLAFGDRKGNRRLDCLKNILQNPQVGMLFLVPGMGETVRVNGTARIVAEAPYLSRLVVQGVQPQLAVEVRLVELFVHCSKAFARSALWDPGTWPPKRAVPTAGQMIRSQHHVAEPARNIDEMLRRDAEENRY
ncbi:MAG TPA: MSMEG_1061 family FMN-dependent PPOX-type flavoprotein [Actinophytocola sp.]|nr:MSMEG_1061 family FMN-dependent PPOX-type flavoprotein [Actinophytocola sp.]